MQSAEKTDRFWGIALRAKIATAELESTCVDRNRLRSCEFALHKPVFFGTIPFRARGDEIKAADFHTIQERGTLDERRVHASIRTRDP